MRCASSHDCGPSPAPPCCSSSGGGASASTTPTHSGRPKRVGCSTARAPRSSNRCRCRRRPRWAAPPTPMRLRPAASAVVQAGGQRLETGPLVGDDVHVDFTAEPGMDITVTATTPPLQPWVYAALYELTPAGERLPTWER